MLTVDLGRLHRVDLRTVWTNEATSFTPWLSQPDNLALLGEAIGCELSLEGQEQNVGPFRADLLCKDASSDRWVLIENQIERTDHGHLGQLLTYAAGLQAVTIIWIAARFTDEHRAALDWLNEVTKEDISFFGLEIELWRIGDSPAAPKFNIVSRPNEFVKVGQAARSGGNQWASQYLEYWTKFDQLCQDRKTRWRISKAIPYYDPAIRLGRSDCRMTPQAGMRDKFVAAWFLVYEKAGKSRYRALESRRQEIEAKIPGLIWHPKPDMQRSVLEVRRPDMDPNVMEDWPRQHEWLLDQLNRMYEVLLPIMRTLGPAEDVAGPEDSEIGEGDE